MSGIVATSPDTTTVNFSLERPQWDVPASSLNLIAHAGLPTHQSLPITNSGDGVLQIRASVISSFPAGNWLTIQPDTLTVSAGASAEFSISVQPDAGIIDTWDYQGEILFQSNACPDSVVHFPVLVFVLDAPDRNSQIPKVTMLGSAYPNPFNSSTSLEYSLAHTSETRIDLFNINGRLIETFVNHTVSAGVHQLNIDGKLLASGVYFLKLQADDKSFSQKLLLLK